MMLVTLFALLACHAQPDTGDTSAASCPDTDFWWYVTVPANTLAQIEIPDGGRWRVMASGDCLGTESGAELCPDWDLSSGHEVRDGWLTTINEDVDGYVANRTDRAWRVYTIPMQDQ